MKKAYLLELAMACISLLGCSEAIESFEEISPMSEKSEIVRCGISKDEAMVIANKVLGHKVTMNGMQKSISATSPTFDFVMNSSLTRSSNNLPDTLAYVINYPNDGGFVIVATTPRVYPVLGFSDKGKFSFENESAKSNFIDNIAAYVGNADKSTTYEVSDNDFDGCYVINPMVQISLGQGSPWNKYVVQDHPGCLAGCVAVASALVMSHAKTTLTYHGSEFQLKSIITALSGEQSTEENDTDVSSDWFTINGNSTDIPQYTYEQAVDSMAKFLYWIGKDVDMNYGTSASWAYSEDAYKLCYLLGFNIPTGYTSDFDIKEVTSYLKNNYIIYLRGTDINGKGGHAWVSDGCYYCVDMADKTKILDTYIHCDWGWGGYCNGYYSGSVFEASSYNFRPQNFFAVKREYGGTLTPEIGF